MLPDQDDSAVVTVSTSSSPQRCELHNEGTLSPGSPDENDSLDTSTCTVTAPTSPQYNLLEKDDTFLTSTVQTFDNAELDASSEHEPTSELTDLPHSCKELGSNSSTQSILDIGEIFSKVNSPTEFTTTMQSLTTAQKYELMTKHKVPHKSHVIPTQYLGGCNRSFRPGWLSEHPWMVYSEKVDGVFCIVCAMFCTDPSKGYFVSKPFRIWNKKSEKAKEHVQSKYHQKCTELADDLKFTIEHPHTTIVSKLDAHKAANIERNRSLLKSIASAVLFCGRQCIALRGYREDYDSPGNHGNFLSLLKLLAVHDNTLRSHLQAPVMRNATYVSAQTQNELIEVMGKHIILQNIVNDVNSSPFYSILADEVTSYNVEHLAICVRFLDSKQDIREEFLAIMPLQRITGAAISEALLQFLNENNIPTCNMRGQGYDGASNMSSNVAGVQARIKEVAPLATYIHCSGHCLNLVISKSCSLPQIRNVYDRMQSCWRFFLNSPKRIGLLELIVKHNITDDTKRKPLLDLCKTRWAERQDAYRYFYQAYIFITESLELIGYQQHLDKYGSTFGDWDTSSRSDAQQTLASITTFEFITVFLTIYQYLSHLAGITVKLQKRALDIVEAYEQIKEVFKMFRDERQNIDSGFDKIYDHAIRIAEKIGTTAEMPRVASRQRHRSNTEAANPLEYYKRNVAIPFLDHIIAFIDQQFSQSSINASLLLGLVPNILCSKDVDLQTAVSMYNEDLPSPELFEMELKRWKNKYTLKPADQRPSSPALAIKECDRDMFPNIYILLQITCTIPVTSCECERSASGLRRLNNYMRALMGKNRLSNLALLHIHYDTPVDLDKVVDIYAKLHPRRLELNSLLYD